MATILTLIVWLVGIAAYVYIGIFLARTTIQLLRSGDRESWIAFLMMPMRCYRRDGQRMQRLTAGDRKAMRLIIGFNVLLWPLKVVWNVPGWVVFGPLIIARRIF